MGDMNWWGNSGVAHHVPVLSTMKTACGHTLLYRGKDFTRFTQDTGEPWPRCARCVAALARVNGSKISAPEPSKAKGGHSPEAGPCPTSDQSGSK